MTAAWRHRRESITSDAGPLLSGCQLRINSSRKAGLQIFRNVGAENKHCWLPEERGTSCFVGRVLTEPHHTSVLQGTASEILNSFFITSLTHSI